MSSFGNRCYLCAVSLLWSVKNNEPKALTTFLVEKLGRGILIMSGNVETPKLPSKMKDLLARLAKVVPPRM